MVKTNSAHEKKTTENRRTSVTRNGNLNIQLLLEKTM